MPGAVMYAPNAVGQPVPILNPLVPDGVPIYSMAEVQQQPAATSQVRPVFPFELRRAGVSGSATVSLVVDEFGVPRNVTCVEANDPGFAKAAVDSVIRWRFRPGRLAGRPVRVHMQFPIYFGLNNDRGGYPGMDN